MGTLLECWKTVSTCPPSQLHTNRSGGHAPKSLPMTAHLDRASRSLSPVEYLSTPFGYSDYLYLCEAPDMKTFPLSSVSGDDTQMTDSSFSDKNPSYTSCDQRADPEIPRQYTPVQSLNLSISRSSSRIYEEGFTKKRTSSTSQPLRAPSPETAHDDSEWEAFMGDMAKKLSHLQDGLDAVISSAKPDFLIAAQTAMTTIQDGLQQLLP
ncbi:hypothetical protein Mapa_007865 [Marchantia paleacea]|nr:hypothetical protein Mapa_007865 [Marchantia paleacea]